VRATIEKATLGVIVAGLVLHIYTAVFKSQGGPSIFLLALGLASMIPYGLAYLVGTRSKTAAAGLGAACACLAGDLFMHYSVFVTPKGSTAALGLLFMPVWNLFLIGPSGAIVGWTIHRALQRADDAP